MFNNVLGNLGNAANQMMNPRYVAMQKEVKQSADYVAIGAVITAIAATIFAIVVISTACLGCIWTPIICAFFAVPIGCLAYNGMMLSSNLKKMADHLALYLNALGLAEGLNEDYTVKTLCNGTFGCQTFVAMAVRELNQGMQL